MTFPNVRITEEPANDKTDPRQPAPLDYHTYVWYPTHVETLTRRQSQALDFIARHIEDRGYPPSVREVASRLSVAIGTAQDHIAALEAKGVLRRDGDAARALQVVAARGAPAASHLPLLGRVPAGTPVEALENLENHVSVDRDLARGADYALRVKGDSMTPEVLEGDLVLVKQAAEASNGDLVIAFVREEGEATVKRLRRRGREAWLEPANPRHRPIKASFRVIGKVTGLLRGYGKS